MISRMGLGLLTLEPPPLFKPSAFVSAGFVGVHSVLRPGCPNTEGDKNHDPKYPSEDFHLALLRERRLRTYRSGQSPSDTGSESDDLGAGEDGAAGQ